MVAPSPDEDLLISADSLLSLILARESSGLTAQTLTDLRELLPSLRARTDQIIRDRH